MTHIERCPEKSLSQLTLEWDRLAEERHRQISSGKDLSFDHILAPTILRLLNGADKTLLLDIGSGTGDLTNRLAHTATKIVGIEPSAKSVAVARATCANAKNIELIHSSLEKAQEYFDRRATAAVASMTLMTAPGLMRVATSLSRLLETGAVFVATIAHPCFWPRYWKYDNEPWFNYADEIYVAAPFVISQSRTEYTTTHIHRPLEMYVRVFRRAGFMLDSVVEPMPSIDVQALYPQPWQFPRFIGFRWRKSTIEEVDGA